MAADLAAALEAARSRFGVVRVAGLTALDRLGVPVVSVTRLDPLGESVSVCSAADPDPARARLRALAEAVERWCGEPRGAPPVTPTPEAPPTSLILADPTVPTTAWCLGEELGTGLPRAVPAWAVYFPWEPPWPAAPGTTGLAFGADLADATERGLRECIERDAWSRAVCTMAAGGALGPLIAPEAAGPRVVALVGAVAEAGLSLRLRALVGDVAVPVVHALVWEEGPTGRPWAHEGVACRARWAAAAESALLEAIQGRMVDIQGAREDLEGGPELDPHPGYFAPGDAGGPPSTRPDTAEGLEVLLAAVATAGLPRPVRVQLGPAGGPGVVVRVVAPEMEVCAIDPRRVGRRAHAWLAE